MLRRALLLVTMLFLVHDCVSSPVYTMQPAYITANIGASTGRNIRRLPCVSRRSGMSGTCMFAIDCLKANGTHLGTCIDRFYFGSCCHTEPINDLSNNVIDTVIMPDRQPPYRMSSTTERSSTVGNTTTTTTTSAVTTLSTLRPTDGTTSTQRTIITMTRRPGSSVATTEKLLTTTLQKVSLAEAVTKPPRVPLTTTTIPDTTSRPTTESYKLSTFQSVDDGTEATTTIKLRPPPIKVTTAKPGTTRPRPTVKPTVVTTKRTHPTPRPTTKPSTIKPTTKPPVTRPVTVKPTTKVKPTTGRPSSTSSGPVKTTTSVKPVKVVTTQRPAVTAVQRITSLKPGTTRITTVKPSTARITTVKPSTARITTVKPSTARITTARPSTSRVTTVRATTTPATTTTDVPVTSKLPDSVTEEPTLSPGMSNEVVLTTTTTAPLINALSGNTATNEIIEQPTVEKTPVVVLTTTEKSTTQMAGLVTWAMVNSNNEQTTNATLATNQSNVADTEDEWTPITPPDGWVLLPSVSTTTQPVTNDTATSTESTTTTTTTINNDDTTLTTLPISSSSTRPAVDSTTMELVPLVNVTSAANTQETTPAAVVPTDAEPVSTVSTPKPVNMTDHTDGTRDSKEPAAGHEPVAGSQVCGRRMYPEPRIVGGEKSSFGKWPWQISLRQWKTSTYLHKCGAALLNENWAITAAHCVENVPPSDLLLRLGEHDLSTDTEPYIHQERRVQIVASHPQFDPRTFEYDLALLRFYEPVQFQPNIIPVCVPQDDESFVGRSAFVTGWGRLYEDGPLPSVLQEVSVPVINNTVCESMYRNAGYIEHIPNIFICAGWKHGGFDSCEGDSGGPMVIQRADKRFLLAGIISWGIGCAEPNQPGVYTRISEFRDWINQILQF